jgi:hypothetical protein
MDEDPGWQLSWKTALYMVVPQLAMREARRAPDALVSLRRVFVAFCSALVLIGVVVVILGDLREGKNLVALAVVVTVAAGCLSLVAQRLLSKPLDCASPEQLAATYRSRFFLRVAFSDASALIAFAMNIATGAWWVYYIGAAFAAIGFAMLAPTRDHLRREADALAMAGCPHSLIAALRGPNAGGAAQ